MAVRYHVLISDELMAMDDLPWPECLRPAEQEPTDPARYPGMHWWLFEDDDAPAELEGKRVELTFTRASGFASEDSSEPLGDGRALITERRVMA